MLALVSLVNKYHLSYLNKHFTHSTNNLFARRGNQVRLTVYFFLVSWQWHYNQDRNCLRGVAPHPSKVASWGFPKSIIFVGTACKGIPQYQD